jgi:putative peptide zinc metalloprotease protein
MSVAQDRTLPPRRQGLLASFAVASTVYRCIVVIAVLWGLREVARTYHLEMLVALLGCITLVGMVWPAAARIVGLVRDPSRGRRIAPARAALMYGSIATAVLAIVLLPVPMRVAAPVVIEYRDALRVYVTVPGTLATSVHIGQTVQQGQTLAQLKSAAVELDVARLTSQRDQQQLYLADLEARRLQGVIDGAQIPAAKAALADARQQLAQIERDAARLTIVAPRTGIVLPPPSLPRKPPVSDRLDRWSGMPFDERNRESFLETGTLLCLVGDPARFEAVLHVEQTDIELVQTGQRVRIMLDHLPGEVFLGTVVEVAKLDLKVMPRELSAARDLPARIDQRGVSHPLDTWYQARVLFDEDPPRLLARVHGRAKITVTPRSLGAQLARYLKQTFSR